MPQMLCGGSTIGKPELQQRPAGRLDKVAAVEMDRNGQSEYISELTLGSCFHSLNIKKI